MSGFTYYERGDMEATERTHEAQRMRERLAYLHGRAVRVLAQPTDAERIVALYRLAENVIAEAEGEMPELKLERGDD